MQALRLRLHWKLLKEKRLLPSCPVLGSHLNSRLRKKFCWLSKVYWKENIVWSPGYFVSTMRIDEQKILKYVKCQENQDLGQAKLELK